MENAGTCGCGNKVDSATAEHCLALGEPVSCEWCLAIADEPPHTGHWSSLGGTYWCDTCDSPLCDLA
jgi:hypothetical protein